MSADLNLLSLLQKAANPIQQLNVQLNLKGIYAVPQQWKVSDESNPGVFTYSVQFMGYSFNKGKIQPRKLTQKQLREQQEAKNKKGSKKQSKQQQKPVVQDPDALLKQAEWQAMSQQQRFFATQEDPFKSFQLLFSQNKAILTLNEEKIANLQQLIENKSVQIIFTRKPEGGEQQIAKLKKAKPKTLNLGQLYTAKYKGKLDLKVLQQPGQTKVIGRVNIEQYGDIPGDCTKIQPGKCYIYLQLILSQAINPAPAKTTLTSENLFQADSDRVKAKANHVNKLRQEIKNSMRAISQQYSNFYAKQKQYTDDRRNINTTNVFNVSTLRINEINKKKQQFLQDFIASGKLNIIQQRLGKTIKNIIVDRCRKQKQGKGISKTQLYQIISELNVFLQQLLQKTLDQCVTAQNNAFHEDLILGHQFSRNLRKQGLVLFNQPEQDRQLRLAHDYQSTLQTKLAQQKYLNLMLIQGNSRQSLQNYAKFCCRNGMIDKAYGVYILITKQTSDIKYKIIKALFLIERNRQKQAAQLLKLLVEGQQSTLQQKYLIYYLLCFTYQRIKDDKTSEKYLILAEIYFKFKSTPNIRLNPPKNPYIEQTPNIPKPGKYVSQLSSSQFQQATLNILSFLVDNYFLNLARDYLPKLSPCSYKQQTQVKIFLNQNKFDQALQKIDHLLEKDEKNIQLMLLKADICFKSDKLFQCQEVFMTLLKLKPPQSEIYFIYLRLAMTYLHRKSWADAKLIFNKALQVRPNSAGAWLGLGIANLQLNLLKQSEQAFNLSTLYNPISNEAKGYLQKIRNIIDQDHKKNYKYFSQVK